MGLKYDSDQWYEGSTAIIGAGANFIGIVTVANPGATGNVTLDAGSRTGILGNLTLSDPKNFIGLVTATLGSMATVTLGTLGAGEDLTNDVLKVEQRFSYQALTSLVTLTVKSGAGFLHTLTIGNISGPTIELYDNTAASGTLIGRINAGGPMNTYTFDASFATGLTVNPQPGTAVLPNLSVSYR